MQEILVIDYGMGNLHSVQKALAFLGASSRLTKDPLEIERAEKLILPGVGAFGDAMAELDRLRLTSAIQKAAGKGVPLLGICLGMQLLYEESTEGGAHKGLGLVPGNITLLDIQEKVPHMGWNSVENRDGVLFANLPEEFSVYFVHSFCAQAVDTPYAAGITRYGVPFVSAVHRDNVFGCQFHPEKSGENGMQILRNFLALGGGSC